ncbi:hypothetical protein MTP99_018597 [Tenebrio molitor]|nr:hypothetical protein MTP99_018597 [Tenebrio molitor]
MSSSEDSYEYETYSLEFYEEGDGPPLIKKRSRLIAALVQNTVDVFKELLDSPRWYNVKDHYGYNLMQIAIMQENEEIFDYLMSLDDYPLEFVNEYGETALTLSLTGFVNNDNWMGDHFALELIKKGANVQDYQIKMPNLEYGESISKCGYGKIHRLPLESCRCERNDLEKYHCKDCNFETDLGKKNVTMYVQCLAVMKGGTDASVVPLRQRRQQFWKDTR